MKKLTIFKVTPQNHGSLIEETLMTMILQEFEEKMLHEVEDQRLAKTIALHLVECSYNTLL